MLVGLVSVEKVYHSKPAVELRSGMVIDRGGSPLLIAQAMSRPHPGSPPGAWDGRRVAQLDESRFCKKETGRQRCSPAITITEGLTLSWRQ